VVGLIEEKSAIANERQRGQESAHLLKSSKVANRNVSRVAPVRFEGSASVSSRCWSCGQFGHFRRNCPRDSASPGKRAAARRSIGPRAKCLSGLRKITAVPRDSPLWVTLELKVGKVPALIDTGAQFPCIRSDVAEFLYLREEPCVFTSCSVTRLLADGQRCEVTDAVRLHVKIL
jgi:hypothetical protein